jgi:hypothetical protein
MLVKWSRGAKTPRGRFFRFAGITWLVHSDSSRARGLPKDARSCPRDPKGCPRVPGARARTLAAQLPSPKLPVEADRCADEREMGGRSAGSCRAPRRLAHYLRTRSHAYAEVSIGFSRSGVELLEELAQLAHLGSSRSARPAIMASSSSSVISSGSDTGGKRLPRCDRGANGWKMGPQRGRMAVTVLKVLGSNLAIPRPMRPCARPGFDRRPELRPVGGGDAEPDRRAGGAEGLARGEDHRDHRVLALLTELIFEGVGHMALHTSECTPHRFRERGGRVS